jgi:hypothetical protein
MMPTNMISRLTLEDFPDNHLIRQDSYYVQKFLRTGERPTHYRATIFLDTIMFSSKAISIYPYPPLNASHKVLLQNHVASNDTDRRTTSLTVDPEANAFALKIATTFINEPLFGIDILKCEKTNNLYALETNLGGNVWHFSSDSGKVYRKDLGGRSQMLSQYKALDLAAKALVANTHKLAR